MVPGQVFLFYFIYFFINSIQNTDIQTNKAYLQIHFKNRAFASGRAYKQNLGAYT